MRFSVRSDVQNAPFRRVRFSPPGQTRHRLTEKRILPPTPHGKAHSGAHRLGRVRLSVRSSSNRDLRVPAQPAPQAGGGLLERVCPVGPFSIVPRSLAGGCPTPPGRRDVTERRILSARLTKRRTLRLRRHGNATHPRGRTQPSSRPRPDRPCESLHRTHSYRL